RGRETLGPRYGARVANPPSSRAATANDATDRQSAEVPPSPDPRSDRSDPTLQSRVRLLQRIRQGIGAGSTRSDALSDRSARGSWNDDDRPERRGADATSR